MQTYPDLHRFIRYIRILLMIIFFLSGVLSVTLVHADDGDFIGAKAIGAEESDQGHGITVDTSGKVYTTGFFQSTADFDPGPGTFNLTSEAWNDIFISKLTSNGDFVWAKAMGGDLDEYGKGIFVDNSGKVHTTGYFQGTVDFDPGTGTFNLTSLEDSSDIFIALLSGPPSFPWSMFLPAIIGADKTGP